MKYVEHRSREIALESRDDRRIFNKDNDVVNRRDAVKEVMDHTSTSVNYHKIVLSPSDEEPIHDWREWTRQVMHDLEEAQGKDLHWFAVHHQNTEHPHVHVVVAGAGYNQETGREEPVKLYTKDYDQLRESGREHSDYHFLAQYHQCFVFAPTEPRTSHHYNPLTHVHIMNDAEAMANCLIDNTGTSREEFWNSAPKLLVASTVLHLRIAEPDAPFSRLIDLLCGTTLENFETLFRRSPSPLVKKVATAFFEHVQKNDRLAGSIMVEMLTHFFFFNNPDVNAWNRFPPV